MIANEYRQNPRVNLNTVNITGRLEGVNERHKCRFYLRDFCSNGFGLWTLESLDVDAITNIRLEKIRILYGQQTETFPETTAKEFQCEAEHALLVGSIQWSQRQTTSHGFHSGIKLFNDWATSKIFTTITESAVTFENPAFENPAFENPVLS